MLTGRVRRRKPSPRRPQLDQVPTLGRRGPGVWLADVVFSLLIGLVLALLPGMSDQGLPGLVRLVLGVYFVLHLPGYWLTAALWPGRYQLTGIERFGLSLGNSIVLVSLLSLLIDRLGWGLRPTPILVSELSATALFALIAVVRRSRLAAAVRYAPLTAWSPLAWVAGIAPAERALLLTLVAVLGVVGSVTFWILITPPVGSALTEFYMLGPDGRAEGFPRSAAPGAPLTVQVGISNRETGARRYQVEAWSVDRWDPSRRERLAQSDPLVVAAGERLEWPLTWRMYHPGLDQLVELLLLAGDDPTPYRRLKLWLDVVTPPAASPPAFGAGLPLADPRAVGPTSAPIFAPFSPSNATEPPTSISVRAGPTPLAATPTTSPEPGQPAPLAGPPDQSASSPLRPFAEYWVRNYLVTSLWSAPTEGPEVEQFGETGGQFCAFLVVRPQVGARLFVFNPVSQNYFWIDAAAVGPVGAPPQSTDQTDDDNCASADSSDQPADNLDQPGESGARPDPGASPEQAGLVDPAAAPDMSAPADQPEPTNQASPSEPAESTRQSTSTAVAKPASPRQRAGRPGRPTRPNRRGRAAS
jgi:uncharacterized membrane protein